MLSFLQFTSFAMERRKREKIYCARDVKLFFCIQRRDMKMKLFSWRVKKNPFHFRWRKKAGLGDLKLVIIDSVIAARRKIGQ